MNDSSAPADGLSLAFLAGGGEMGQRMRTHDWSATPLGAPADWPQSLKTIVRMMLDSRYAMWMAWGPALTFFCNDAYLPTVGIKRDWVLGARSDEVWKEIWPDIGPLIEHVLGSGLATWDEGLLLFLERSGFTEETYHTFSYSPVYDDQSRVAGMLCVVTEVTERVIGERRLRVLRDLAAQAIGVTAVDDACRRAIDVLAKDPMDLSFAAVYLMSSDGQDAACAALSRPLPGDWFPPQVKLSMPDDRWGFGNLRGAGSRSEISDLPRFGLDVAAVPWPDRVQSAVVLPLQKPGQDRLLGVLVAGLSPRRALDEAYRSFLDLISGQLASAIANAQAYDAERQRADALAEIDRAKTAFFSNVSHEFRTPLTLMLGPIEDMVGDADLPDAVRSRLEVVFRNALRLLKLVNSLLEFSRIEAGRVQAVYMPTDLAALTRELVSTFESALELAGLTLRCELDPLPEPVYVDRDMWEKIVLNLLSNAFKFTLRGGVDVRMGEAQGQAVLTVSDTGIGIPPEAVPRLFERFYRVEGAEGRTHEGSGIGLALVNELVRLHGGTVDVESGVGEGTTFTIRLPLGRTHLPVESIQTAQSSRPLVATARAYAQEALRWLPDSATGVMPSPSPQESAQPADVRDERPDAVRGARLLIADDNADMRNYVRDLLATRYSVEVVGDGEAALDAARRLLPDLIVSDVMMPRMDGFALLRAVRAEPALRDVPIILLSARAGEEAVVEGLDAMADDYLVKPFAARELLARVGAQLQLARLRREARDVLQQRTAQFETLLNEAPLGVFLVDADFRIRNVNPAALPGFGNIPNLIGRDFGDVMRQLRPGPEADKVARRFRHTLDTGEPFATHERLAHTDRQQEGEYYEWQISRIPLPDGRFGVVCYFRDVSAYVKARIALETADRQKNEFLAMLAHELRNPLAPIRNAAELLTRTLPADPRTQSVVAMVTRQTGQLTRLVDDLLDVSRITQNRVELRRRTLEVGSVVSQAIETTQPLFEQKAQQFYVGMDPRKLYVDGDMERLVQCVVNVLTNAAKYTDAGGRIELTTRADGQEAVIEIADTGAGISEELLPRVFDLFVQGDRTLDRSLGGLGIGLSIAKRLIEMHRGRMTVRSPGLGAGSVFEIRLPLVERPPEPVREGTRFQTVGKRVLIVDDNRDAANSLALVLSLNGHVTESVYSARDALARAEAFGADVVLLDIGLPELDGYEVARRLRARSALANLRLIALTGYGQPEDLRRTREAGFDDHLVKPVDFAVLERALAGDAAGAGGNPA